MAQEPSEVQLGRGESNELDFIDVQFPKQGLPGLGNLRKTSEKFITNRETRLQIGMDIVVGLYGEDNPFPFHCARIKKITQKVEGVFLVVQWYYTAVSRSGPFILDRRKELETIQLYASPSKLDIDLMHWWDPNNKDEKKLVFTKAKCMSARLLKFIGADTRNAKRGRVTLTAESAEEYAAKDFLTSGARGKSSSSQPPRKRQKT